MQINPDIPAAVELRSWYNTHGKNAKYMDTEAALLHTSIDKTYESPCMQRTFIADIKQPAMGKNKPAYFNVKCHISFIDPEQPMWYQACMTCNKKVVNHDSTFWSNDCHKNTDSCKRYILSCNLIDTTGEIRATAFDQEAQQILGHTAEQLCAIKNQESSQQTYRTQLKKATWILRLLRISVLQVDSNYNQKQKVIIRQVAPIDWSTECMYVLHQIDSLQS